MAESKHLSLFCYDVKRHRTRRKISAFLEERLVRVQKSIFEGRLTRSQAYGLFDQLIDMVDEDDNLRLYIMTKEGREKSRVHGGAPLLEEGSFILL